MTGYYSYQYTAPGARADFALQIPFMTVFDSMAAIKEKTAYSWGEYVNINFYEPQPGMTRIIIESRPRGPQQAAYQVHQYHVNAVYSYIVAMFSRPPVY